MEHHEVSQNVARAHDAVEQVLVKAANLLLMGGFGLLPIIFFPLPYAALEYTKTFVIIIVLTLSVLLYGLSVLRAGELRVQLPRAFLAFCGVIFATVVSALLSGDVFDAFIGDTMRVGTACFTLVLGGTMLAVMHIARTKAFIMRLYVLLMVGALVLGLLTILRVLIGGDHLTLGILFGPTANVFGGFNDLALFFGLVVLLALVALEQLPLTRIGRALFSVMIVLSLVVLAVVNFFAVWMVLGLVSLILLMYSLTKDHFKTSMLEQSGAVQPTRNSAQSVLISVVVFITALVFIMGNSVLGNSLSKLTGISYVEVRPSFQATVDVMKATYSSDAVLGVGPGRFADAWRQHRDPALNQTLFWATDFPYGSGFLVTQFVTTGVLGGIAWVIFLVSLLVGGIRTLFAKRPSDRTWYFIATASFTAAMFLWFMSVVYTPGTTVLLLAALFTGLLMVAQSELRATRTYTVSVQQNRQAGFVLVGGVMLVIIASVSTLYYSGRHFSANLMFAGAASGLDGSENLETVERTIVSAFELVQSDTYARQLALFQVSKMNALLNRQQPTPEEQQEFSRAAATGLSAARQAVALDPTDPINHTTEGALLSIMALTGMDQAAEAAAAAFERARSLDPVNPSYALLEAQLLARTNDSAGARVKLESAITAKPNYTDALFMLSQLDIQEGRVDEAIALTRSIIALDPNNPARYYQLGVLLSANDQIDTAVGAFEQAVALDPKYANARYFLGLAYFEQGRREEAIAELRTVAELNPSNTQALGIIDQIETGGTVPSITPDTPTSSEPVADEQPVTQSDDGTVLINESPDTDLVTPVNGLPADEETIE